MTAEEERLAKLSTEENRQRAIDEELGRLNNEYKLKAQAAQNPFSISTPEFIICRENQKAMEEFFRSRQIINPTPLDLQDAYQFLGSRGLLKLNKGKILLDGALEQFQQIDNSEERLYEMPLDELRLRAANGGSL